MPVVRLTIQSAPMRGLLFLIVLSLLLCPSVFAQTVTLPTGDASVVPSPSLLASADPADGNDGDGSEAGPGQTFDPDPQDDASPAPEPDPLADWTDDNENFANPWLSASAATPTSFPDAVPVVGWVGAMGVNIGWQSRPQTSPRPLVQVQGGAGDDLLNQSGYSFGADRLAAAGVDWVEIDWMRKYLAPTGEFPGNGNGTPGNNFFDMMNGMASFTRGARAMAQSSAWNSVYASKLADETPVWNRVCQWLTTPSVKAVGDAYNALYTHRYWMGASVLRNEAYLLRLQGGTSNNAQAAAYDAIAVDYENQAMARQMGPGWRMALYPKFSDGRCRASILYNPSAGDPIPAYFDGTKSNRQLCAEGVNPEQGDAGNETWDAIYNPNGDKLAVWSIGVQGPGQHRQDCSHAVDMNLLCAMQFLTSKRDNQGSPILIDPNGSGRVGTLDIHGNPKKVNPNAWRDIFRVQAGLAPDHKIYGGSHYAACRALFAAVFHWFDNVLRNPSASIPAPPAIPSDLYPSL